MKCLTGKVALYQGEPYIIKGVGAEYAMARPVKWADKRRRRFRLLPIVELSDPQLSLFDEPGRPGVHSKDHGIQT